MSFGATKLLSASGGKAYEIDQSITLAVEDAPKLRRTPSSAGNRRTFTFSTWCKRASLGNGGTAGSDYNYLLGAYDSSVGSPDDDDYFAFGFFNSDALVVGGWSTTWRLTNRLFRDTSAWYHLVLQVDTTQGTADNRFKFYVNGVQETSFSTSNNPSQNFDGAVNNTVPQSISDTAYDSGTGPYHFNGYMAETHLFDGAVVAPSEFGETDSVSGAWIPKKYVGSTSYGTNGYYMKFASGAIGTDSSGQGNNYTTTNLANSDVVLDTPTNNFPTVNSVEPWNTTVSTLVQGNRKVLAASYSSGNYGNHFMTFKLPESGKWYVEMVGGVQAGGGNRAQLVVNEGFIIPSQSGSIAANANSTGIDLTLYGNTLDMYDGGSTVGTQVTGLTASYYVLALAIDVDNNKVYGGYDSGSAITWLNSGDPAGNSNGTAHTFTSESLIGVATTTSSDDANRSYLAMNFGQSSAFGFSSWSSRNNTDGSGQGDFYYAPPSGFKALCSQNLPTPTIKKSTEHFNPVLWTGDGASTRSITGVGFQPDFTWTKSRTDAYSHLLYDAVRGAGVSKGLKSNSDAVEGENDNSTYGYLSAFASDGFNLVHGSASASFMNENNDNMVAWSWKLGGTAPSKTYAVKVVSDSGNKYRFDDYGTSAVTLNLQEGGTYTFDQSDSSNATHPLRFSTTSDGGHGGGSEYTTGVTTNGTPGSSGAYTRITVAASAPTLYYYCTAHSGMGGQVNTNTTFGSTYLDGDIPSVVSANTTAGISILTFTANGTNAGTIPHGLGVVPKVAIKKRLDSTGDWHLRTTVIDGSDDYLALNTTAAASTFSASYGSMTSEFVTNSASPDGSSQVFYVFAEVAGFSKFGAYTGNGSTNGPHVYTGFRPAFIMVKSTASGTSWFLWDNKRDSYNPAGRHTMWADATNGDTDHSSYYVDFLSNGFKLRGTNAGSNNSGTQIFYMAFSKFPFKYANAR